MQDALQALLTLLAAFAFALPVIAQTYPTKPIRFIVPYAPGGNADIMARVIGQRLSEALGEPVVVDNRPGANSIIGTEMAVRSAPDGYTVLIVASGHAVNPSLVRKLPYDTLKDLAPITLIGSTPLIVVAHPSLPANTIKELIALAKSHPGELNYASSGNGSPANLAGALLNVMAGIKLTHVPYKGTSQATTDVMSGQVQIAFPSMTSTLPFVKSGKLKGLAMTALRRSPLAPDMPTVAEAGVPGYQASIWNGMLVPGATPKAIVTRLNQEVVKVLKSPETQQRYAGMGADILYGTPEEFDAFTRAEMKKWDKVIREAGIRVDLAR